MSRYLFLLICVVGLTASLILLLDSRRADKISAMPDQGFTEFLSSYAADQSSVRELRAVADRALTLTPPNFDVSKAATKRLLDIDATCLDCQNRMVIFDIEENNGLTEKGIDSLRNSFALSPYGKVNMMQWRLQIASEFWEYLDVDLQAATLSQITVLSQQDDGVLWLKNLETDVDSIAARIRTLERN